MELRVPGVLREADVVPLRRERGRVELDARVDAVVRRAIGRERSAVVGVRGVERDTSRGRVRGTGRGTGEATVVERDADGAVRRDVEVRLELVDRSGVVVDLDRRAPRRAVVV